MCTISLVIRICKTQPSIQTITLISVHASFLKMRQVVLKDCAINFKIKNKNLHSQQQKLEVTSQLIFFLYIIIIFNIVLCAENWLYPKYLYIGQETIQYLTQLNMIENILFKCMAQIGLIDIFNIYFVWYIKSTELLEIYYPTRARSARPRSGRARVAGCLRIWPYTPMVGLAPI